MMIDVRCARAGCTEDPTHHVWGWVNVEGLTGWSLLRLCDAHFAAVEPGLRHGEQTGHVVVDGPMPTEPPPSIGA